MGNRWQAGKDKPYFVYDPDGDGFSFFETEKERDGFAEDCIQLYLDDGWDDGVENVIAGEATHTAQQTDRIDRPTPDLLDADGCDEHGNDWNHNDFEYVCNYKMLPL